MADEIMLTNAGGGAVLREVTPIESYGSATTGDSDYFNWLDAVACAPGVVLSGRNIRALGSWSGDTAITHDHDGLGLHTHPARGQKLPPPALIVL